MLTLRCPLQDTGGGNGYSQGQRLRQPKTESPRRLVSLLNINFVFRNKRLSVCTVQGNLHFLGLGSIVSAKYEYTVIGLQVFYNPGWAYNCRENIKLYPICCVSVLAKHQCMTEA